MKNLKFWTLALLASFSVVLGFSSPVQAFPVQAYVEVTPFQARAQVTNYYSYPISCSVRVQGLRNDGFSLWGETRAVLYPGISAWATAFTQAPSFFVNAWSFADCY